MYTGRVIENQRFCKVTKKANHYPQVWYVNLETLAIYCLTSMKTESMCNQNKRLVFLEINRIICRKRNKLKIGANYVSTYAEKTLVIWREKFVFQLWRVLRSVIAWQPTHWSSRGRAAVLKPALRRKIRKFQTWISFKGRALKSKSLDGLALFKGQITAIH